MRAEEAGETLAGPGRGEPTLRVEVGLKAGTTAEREETTELFTRHASGIYRYCLRRLGSPEEAEDALQVTYLNAWRSLKEGSRPRAQRAWLFQIAANVCSSALRSKLGSTRVEAQDPTLLEELIAVEDSEKDELLGLTEALRELPSRQRHALVRRDWQGLSYNEIATEMAVSDAAVETLLFRARNKVASTLANPEWRGKLAPSARAFLVWPFAFLRTKSAALTGAEHLKLGLTLAGGTVTPLVVFGLIQFVLDPAVRADPNQRPAIVQDTAPAAFASWLRDEPFPHAVNGRGSDREKPVRSEKKTRKHVRSGQGPSSHSKAHAPTSPAPAAATAHESKIVVCHSTHSDAQPGVTINVSKHALRGLSGDARQACG
jgi:RNA polymerase sigma-70 factor, ECF subfamily